MPPHVRRFGPALLIVSLGAAPASSGQKEDERPAERGAAHKLKVFELRHRQCEDVMRVIKPLASGIRGTSLSNVGELKTITVRDLPEHMAAIEDAIKRLDVPPPFRPDVEVRMRLLVAAPSGPVGNVAPDLEPVVKHLRATLNYKSYSEVAAPIASRVRSGSGAKGNGSAQVSPPVTNEPSQLSYSYAIEDLSVASNPQAQVLIRRLFFSMGNKQLGEADISTGLTIKDNEKVVVGTASLKDRAMILVLSARIQK